MHRADDFKHDSEDDADERKFYSVSGMSKSGPSAISLICRILIWIANISFVPIQASKAIITHAFFSSFAVGLV